LDHNLLCSADKNSNWPDIHNPEPGGTLEVGSCPVEREMRVDDDCFIDSGVHLGGLLPVNVMLRVFIECDLLKVVT
jgi:hypothetical protein